MLVGVVPHHRARQVRRFQPRSVPRGLLLFVPQGLLQEMGASGHKARLRKGTQQDACKEAAIKSHTQACEYLRLTNNTEIGVEVCQSLLQRAEMFQQGILDTEGHQFT